MTKILVIQKFELAISFHLSVMEVLFLLLQLSILKEKKQFMKTSAFITRLFSRDFNNYDGVRPVQVYLLRLVFFLTFVFIGMFSWTTIINHDGEWKPVTAVAFSIWAAYSALSVLGIIKPLKMLPIIALQVLYKSIWLVIVAYPLWASGKLAGSDAEQMTKDFLWVLLPVVAMPWRYFFRSFFVGKLRSTDNSIEGNQVKA
jgi:hypothetical protein